MGSPMPGKGSDAVLLAEYVATFEKRDDTDGYGVHHGQPRPITTLPLALEALYQGLGLTGRGFTRFPPLYEALLLSYRWAEVDLGSYRLLANEPAEDLSPLLSALRADGHLLATLVPNGYVPFGKGPDINYDPVCFDFRQRQKNGDCPVVRLDQEAILCGGRIGAITELAPNLRSLVISTIAGSAAKQGPNTD